MKKLCLILSTIFLPHLGICQDVITDRNAEDVFIFNEAGKWNFKTTSSEGTIKIGYTLPLNSKLYYTENGNGSDDANNKDEFNKEVDDITITKSDALSFSLSVATSNKTFLVTDLYKYRPAYKMEVGYVRTIDSICKLFDKGLQSYTFSIQGWAKVDNIRMHDTSLREEKQLYPISAGLKLGMSFYLSRYFIISLGANAQHTWNKKYLSEYQQAPASFNNGVVITNGDVIGYFGRYEELYQLRTRISIPIILGAMFRNGVLIEKHDDFFLSHMVFTPFISNAIATENLPTTLFGASLSYFSANFSSDKAYNLAQAFGIGMDWQNNSKDPISMRWYAYGTFNFGKPKKNKQRSTPTTDILIR